ncbi:MAG TPA: hypothetical protein VHC90_19220 [Bryobacteraceae bacterium]|nr:hypothetical protein [Bryobacteraceae bacterium]
MLFLLVGLAFQTAATGAPAIEPATYLDFFHETARQVDNPIHGYLNGIPPEVTKPAVSDILGISHEEAGKLLQIAPLCVADIDRLEEQGRALIFRSRLERADTGQISEATSERLKELEARRAAIVLTHVQQMKIALGESTFRHLEDYIRVHAGHGFFPAAVQKPI